MNLTVGWVQQAMTGDAETNMQNITDGVRAAAKSGARLVVLPELHRTHYFCQTENPALFDLSEPVPGPTCDALGSVAAECSVVIVGSVFERRMPGVYHNTAVVLECDGTLAGIYRKTHIPDDPGYYEKFYFTPGDGPLYPVETSVGRLGVLVCWDQWYPEAARLMALAGADILLYPTAIGWDEADSADEKKRQFDAWQTIQRSHAIANGLPLVAVNRCGIETAPDSVGGIRFWGGSFAAGCQGELLASAGEEPDTGLVEIDLSGVERVRRIWPFLRDRRIDLYKKLTARLAI